jgi:hypothetical protein
VTVIALNRLGRNEGARLVHQLAGNLGALPPDVLMILRMGTEVE